MQDWSVITVYFLMFFTVILSAVDGLLKSAAGKGRKEALNIKPPTWREK